MFGGKGGDSTPKTTIFNIDAGGLQSSSKRKKISVSSDANRQGLVEGLAATFPEQAKLLGDLRAKVAPGFSDLRASRLTGLENARRRTIGNLRDNLSRRKIAGSSFANDAVTRANLEFSQEEDRIRAETFLEEIDMTQRIAAQEFEALRGEFSTFIGELNTQLGVATQMASQATAEFNANARFGAQLAAESSSGFGELFGTVLGLGTDTIGGTALGKIGSAALGFLSDRRAKKDISRVGKLANGLSVYAFRYVWGGPIQIGLMADEVEKVHPEAIFDMGGFKAVNYEQAVV